MRWKRRGVLRTASGAVIAEATVQVYLAGTTDPADIYEGPSGGASVNQVSADSEGRYEYYVDAADYSAANRFKEVITKGSTSTTLDNVPIVRWDPTVHQSIAGEIVISGAGHGVTFPDGTRMTSMASPGSGITNTGDVSIAADIDADESGEITFSTRGVARARVANAGGLEINDGGTWRQVASLDGAETLSNKTLAAPVVSDFSNATHDHSDAAGGGALSSPSMTDPELNGSLSGSAIKDDSTLGGATPSNDAVPTQAAVKTYIDTRPQLITEWSQPDDNHPYANAENCATQGKATINLPADSEAWLHGEFMAKSSGSNINVVVDYMMSTADTDPINWGLAYAVGHQRLCDVPWQETTTYTIGDRVCPSTPNGCTYEMIEGAGGFGTTDLINGLSLTVNDDDGINIATYINDDNAATSWSSDDGVLPAWIKADLGSGNDTIIGKVVLTQASSGFTHRCKDFKLQASIDDFISSSVDVYTGQMVSDPGTPQTFTFNCDIAYRYWRILIVSTWSGSQIGQMAEWKAYEILGGTGVSAGGGFGETDLLTGGTASADSSYNASYLPENAVDDDATTTRWCSSTALNAATAPWWKYDLGSGNEADIGKIRANFYGPNNNPDTIQIHASNDDASWTLLCEASVSDVAGWQEFTFTNGTAYRYWKITGSHATIGNAFTMWEVEAFENLGGIEPVWPTTIDGEIADNEITWKCVATDNYDTISLTGETTPSSTWTHSTKTFAIPGSNISSGDPVNLLAIRKVDAPSNYWAKQDLSAATVTAGGPGTPPYGATTIAGLYDGVVDIDNPWTAPHCGWATLNSTSIIGAYIQIQFASAKTIHKFIIKQMWNLNHGPAMKIQYSADGETWNDLQNFTGLNYGEVELVPDSPVEALYYRITLTAQTHEWDNLQKHWIVGEIEAYTYETNSGSGHDGDLHLIRATAESIGD